MGASDPSTQQMALVHSPQFLDRFAYNLMVQAMVIIVESSGIANHVLRAAFAEKVIANAPYQATNNAVMIASSTNLLGTVIGTGVTADSSASDAAILSQVNTNWNAISGVTT